MSEPITEIRNLGGSLLFKATHKGTYWLIETKKKHQLTRIRLYNNGTVHVENYILKDNLEISSTINSTKT